MSGVRPIAVGERRVGPGERPFVIAELSGNHNGSLERALDLVDAAAAAGVEALKIQTYTADTLTIDADGPEFRVGDGHELWGGRTLHDLYTEAHLPWQWHAPIFDRARERGLVPFSTPFDPTAVELLESLGVALYKTASAEIVDLPLMREIARTGKPMIISTGTATLAEIDAAVSAARGAGADDIVLLACTAAYPARPEDARLARLAVLRDAFDLPVGLSDHTRGIGVAVAAVALGAACVEKHVTLDRADGGVDAEFSASPDELAALVRECEAAWLAVGGGATFGPSADEETVLRIRRSLRVVADVRAGDVVSAANVRSIRPAGGLEPDAFDLVAGRVFTRDLARGSALTWDAI